MLSMIRIDHAVFACIIQGHISVNYCGTPDHLLPERSFKLVRNLISRLRPLAHCLRAFAWVLPYLILLGDLRDESDVQFARTVYGQKLDHLERWQRVDN